MGKSRRLRYVGLFFKNEMTDTVIFSSFTPLNADKSNPDPHFPREPFSMLDFRLYHDLRLQSPRILCQQWLAFPRPLSILVGSRLLLLSLLAIFSSRRRAKKLKLHCGNLIDPRSSRTFSASNQNFKFQHS